MIRVLVVDDHQMLADSLVRLLDEDPDIAVIGAEATGAGGIKRAIEEQPDVVVLDFQLPDMDGAAVTRLLLQELDEVKVIVLSGSDKNGALRSAMEAGCAGWIRKTSAIDELIDAVHRVYHGLPVVGREISSLPTAEQLVVQYQPIVELATERVVGFEALVRWAHPTRGLLLPADFLPLAEETGFILELSLVVLKRAITELARWQATFPADPPLWVSVNISASCLDDPHMVGWVRDALAASQLAPRDLVLEVTETVLVNETPETIANIRSLKALGVRLALDDFGTAFSSLSYLRQFPFDHLKIDTSFVAELPGAPRAVLLVESIIHIANVLGMTAIAEGVERADQAECLIAAGWWYGQGYYYSRSLDAADVPSYVASRLE